MIAVQCCLHTSTLYCSRKLKTVLQLSFESSLGQRLLSTLLCCALSTVGAAGAVGGARLSQTGFSISAAKPICQLVTPSNQMLAARTNNLGMDRNGNFASILYGKFLAWSVGWSDVGGSMMQMLGV